MKLNFLISRLSIGQQVLLTALLPLLLLTLALSSYMIVTRIQDAQQALDVESETLMDFLSSASEFGLLTHNVETLQQLSQVPMTRPEVTDVLFISPRLKLLSQSGELSLDIGRLVSNSQLDKGGKRIDLTGLTHTWAIVKPVIMSGVSVDDFDQSRAPDRHLGWVVLVLNDRALLQRQDQIFVWGLAISLVGLLLAVILALRIGRNISAPIKALSHSVKRYQAGDQQIRVKAHYQQEIGALQQGINSLMDQAEQHQRELRSEVDQATSKLKSALTELEQINQKLLHSKERVELSGRAKDDFMARMSHELRTPISSVIGFIRLLEKSHLNDSQREYCRIILSASSLLLRLIDDILDFSKFQSDNVQLENIPFNPELCLEDVVEMQAPVASQKGLTLALQCDAQWPLMLLGDPTRFSQIITNLISNAIKFTEQGGVKVRLFCTREQDRTQLTIEVQDSGIGIPAAELQSLFLPFGQADTSISRRFGGSGLGLVISKRLVELMQGELSLTSVPDEGTQFTVRLYLDDAPEQQSKGLPELKVLLCSPDSECRISLERQMTDWGCSVDTLDDRQQLVPHMMASQSYDRILVCLTLEELKALSWNQFLNPVRDSFNGELILITEHCDNEVQLGTDRLLELLEPARILRLPVGRYRLFQALEARSRPSVADTLPQLSLQGVLVLLVEDNRFNRLLLSRMLQAQGASVETANNGRDGVATVEQKSFDLVIMDLHMPILGGIDACKQIRQLPSASAKTPILILTADVISNEKALLEPLQLQGLLYKPVDEAVLVKQVLRVLNRDQGQPVSEIVMRLQRFGIPEQELKQALDEQFEALQQALLDGDESMLREQSHQLSGLAVMAGLYRLDDQVRVFSQAVKQNQMSEAWQVYWSMKDSIDNSNSIFDLS
ncbi:MAG: ATP-binding protein [Halopseudomonas sp.]